MAKKHADAYSRLVRILILLFVLVVVCGVGYALANASITAQQEENAARARQENDRQQQAWQQVVREEQARYLEETAVVWPEPKGEAWEIVDLSQYPVQNSISISVDRDALMMEGMMLVNHWHAVPSDFPEDELVSMKSVDKTVPVSGSSVKLFPNAAYALSQMLAGAKEAGLENYLIEEAYRTKETQQGHYDKEAANYANRFSGDPLVAKVRQNVNVPGTSEYQSGLSFRIDRWLKGDAAFNEPKFQTTEHSDWLLDNSWKYGFVFRFPVEGYPNASMQDKSYKTGESKKLSVYRYVGVPHASIMHQMNFCMEEYIEYLMEHPHIAIYENGQKVYEITWQPLNHLGNSVYVEYDRKAVDYSVSMDNVGGVITCMTF